MNLNSKPKEQEKSVLKQKSSKKSGQVSIGKGKGLESYSKEQLEANSAKLKSFTEINFANLVSRSSSKFSTCSTFEFPSSTIQQQTPVTRRTNRFRGISPSKPQEENMRSMKLKIYRSDKIQQKNLTKMMGLARKTYNRALDELKIDPTLSKFDLRDKFVKHALAEGDSIKKLSSACRELCAFEAKKNYTLTLKNKRGNWYRKINNEIRKNYSLLYKSKRDKTKQKYQSIIDSLVEKKQNPPEEFPFTMNYKTKKSPTQCMEIAKRAIYYNKSTNEIVISPRSKTLKLTLKLKEKPKDFMLGDDDSNIVKFLHDVKILTCCTGIYLQVPYTCRDQLEKENERKTRIAYQMQNQIKVLPDCFFKERMQVALNEVIESYDKPSQKRDFVSLDPGIRTFLTGIDSDGRRLELGKNLLDDLKDQIYKRNDAQRKSFEGKPITKAILQRKYAKIANKVRNYHCHIAKRLEEYNVVLLPKLSTKGICETHTGKFNDNAHILAHGKFFDRVKMNQPGLIEADERYTTKACCRCFALNDPGSSKDYKCNECGFEADRDLNSAVNILVKNFSQVQGFSTFQEERFCRF